MKPAPPLRPAIVNTNSSSNAVLTSTKKSQPTYEEDALVLRVIEAYCVAYQNPTRNALHSGWLQIYFQFFSCSTLVELNIYWVLVKLVKLVWSRENNNMNAGTFFSLKTLLHFNALTSHHNQTYPFTMSFDIKFELNHLSQCMHISVYMETVFAGFFFLLKFTWH